LPDRAYDQVDVAENGFDDVGVREVHCLRRRRGERVDVIDGGLNRLCLELSDAEQVQRMSNHVAGSQDVRIAERE
jgi:hypothetical protein